MAIFNDELIDKVSNRDYSTPIPDLPSPVLPEFDTFSADVNYGETPIQETGRSIEELSKFTKLGNVRTPGSAFSSVSLAELYANKKYPLYNRDINLENVYGSQQGALESLGHGVIKMAATAAGTFAQSFATIPNTIKAIKSGKLSELSGSPDGYEASIDTWLKNIEDYFPNYYTDKERDHPFVAMIPFAPGSANFWGDKIIKNIGFTIGAIGGALAQDAIIGLATGGLGTTPLIASQIGRASLWMNKIFAGTNKVDKVIDLAMELGKNGKYIMNIKKLGDAAAGVKVINGFRYGTNLYGASRTEAAIEARDSYQQITEELTHIHKINNFNELPVGVDLEEINKYAINAMNVRFGINMALLTVSNAIQFNSLFKAVSTARKGVSTTLTKTVGESGKIGLKEGSIDVFEKVVPSFKGKVWDAMKPKLSIMFSEGVYEEGGQYAAEKGVYDYYTRKYKDPSRKQNVDNWNTLNEVLKSTTEGLSEQFGSEEGIENMIIGAISSLLTGGGMNYINKKKGISSNQQLETAINALNLHGLTGILSDKYDNTLNSVNIAQDMQSAIEEDNVYKYKNLKHEMFFDFVNSRIPSDMHDVTIEQLKILKDLSKEDFEKTFGMDFSKSNTATVGEYIDNLITKANEIEKTAKEINSSFKNPFKIDVNNEEEMAKFFTFESWKKDVGFYSSLGSDTNSRLASMEASLFKINPLLNNDIVASATSENGLREMSLHYEEKANALNETISPESKLAYKKKTRAEVNALRTASEKINYILKHGTPKNAKTKAYGNIINFAINEQSGTTGENIGIENIAEVVAMGVDINKHILRKKTVSKILDTLVSEEGVENYFKERETLEKEVQAQAEEAEKVVEEKPKEVVQPEFINNLKVKQQVEINREYESIKLKKAKVSEVIKDKRYKVTAPDGTVAFYTSQKKALAEAAFLNTEVEQFSKVKVIDINDDGTIKVVDRKGNIKNISTEQLTGYNLVETKQDRLLKNQEQLTKEQDKVVDKSATVETGEDVVPFFEDKLKSESVLFISSTTESEGFEDGSKSAPHIKRSREFLNDIDSFKNRGNLRSILVTANQAKKLGLDGIVQMSYKRDAKTSLKDIENVTDDNLGWVAQVFLIQEKGKTYFVNKNGEKLTELGKKVDLNEVIFQTMPTTSLTNSKGNPRYRSNEKEEATARSKAWLEFREELFKSKAKDLAIFKFTVSRGIAVENTVAGKHERNHVGDVLISENEIETQEELIVIPTTGTIFHNGELIEFPNGIPVLQYGSTLQHLNNREFTPGEAQTIFKVLKALAADIVAQSEAGTAIRFKNDYTTFLQNVLYWKKGKTKTNSQIRINERTMAIELGGISYPLTDIASLQKEITDQLKEAYHAVNNTSLKSENFNEPFVEFYENKEGKLETREWTNYQTYLISAKNPDGTKRSIDTTPLSTSVALKSETVPTSFKAKYVILEDLNLEISIAPETPTETPAEVPKTVIKDFVLDGKTVNTYTAMKAGPIEFTGVVNEKGEIVITVSANHTTNFVAKDELIINGITKILTSAGITHSIATLEDKQVAVISYLEHKILLELEVVQKEESPEEKDIIAEAEARIAASKAATLEGKKADIEKRRKEELNWGDNEFTTLFPQLKKDYPQVPIEGVAFEISVQEYKKAINAKYDEELTILEEKKVEKKKKIKPAGVSIIPDNKIFYNNPNEKGKFIEALKHTARGSSTAFSVDDNNNLWLDPSYKVKVVISTYKALIRPAYSITNSQDVVGGKHNSFSGLRITKLPKLDSEGNIIEKGNIEFTNTGKVEHILGGPPAAKGKKDFSGGKGPSGKYRTVGKDSEERMTDAELQLFKEWHAANVPNIPYEVLNTLITTHTGKKAWGVFENGVAKFVRGGLKATEYHEIFEAIYAGMLSLDEQQALLKEFKAKKGEFTDRESGKKIYYAEATDLQAKERIADDFSDFRKGKLKTLSVKDKIYNFFRNILEFFKSFIVKPSTKDELFKAIDTGKFKDRELNVRVVNAAAAYRAADELTEEQTHDFVQDMVARAAGILYSEGAKYKLYSPEGITSSEMFKTIEEQYDEESIGEYSKRELLGDVAWEQLKQKTREMLRTMGISFDEGDLVNINNEGTNKNDYAQEAFTQDWKKNSSGAIKFSLATVLQVAATNRNARMSVEIPKAAISTIGGYKLMNFSQVFATLLGTLSNTSNIQVGVDKLAELANYDPNYVRVFLRTGGTLPKTAGEKAFIPFKEFDTTDWRYFIQFFQTFTKQKPDALIQYKTGNEVYTAPANLYTSIKMIQHKWIENIKLLALKKDSFITRNKNTQTYQIKSFRGYVEENNQGKWRAISPSGAITLYDTKAAATKAAKKLDVSITYPKDMIVFLSMIGIEFPLASYNLLKEKKGRRKSSQQVIFGKAVSSLYTYFSKNKNLMTISGKTLDINGQLSILASLLSEATNPNQENTYPGVDGERIGSFADNNMPSIFENEFNEANTLDELLEKRPELKDLYSKGSEVLKKGGLFFDKTGKRIKEMKVSYIQGTNLLDKNKGVKTTSLSLGDRFTQEINQNLDGNYYILIPADGSTEWMMNMGNHIKFSELESGRAWNKIYTIFNNYLVDDVALALDSENRDHLKNVKGKARDLRIFKEILFSKDLNAINNLIAKDATQLKIEEYIEKNSVSINKAIKEFIDKGAEETKQLLINNNKILVKEEVYSYNSLQDVFAKEETLDKSNLSEKTLNNILAFANVNYIINNIEYHKVLFGDPYQFAIKKEGALDATKRFKSFFSPRRTTFDSSEFNTFLNQNLNQVKETKLEPKDPGYQTFKDHTNTVTISDNVLVGSLANLVAAYGKTDETDAMSWLMDGTYREIKLKNGQWGEEAEAWHQWQMAWTRQNMPGYKYTNVDLKTFDEALVKTKEPKFTIEVMKPIVSGYKKNKNELVLDKFSQMPIYYSMVKGRNMEKLYIQMMKENVGYAVVEQGRKVGIEESHSLYNQDGTFNTEVFNNKIQVPWKAYGIQVETTKEGEASQTRGSQLTKLSSMDLFDNGVASSEAAAKEYARNKDILNKLHQNAYNTLLNKIGVEDLGTSFIMKDGQKISKALMHEILRRQSSDNTKETLQVDEGNQFLIPFEASPSYIQIRNILYSMIDKAIVHPKMHGGTYVQVPVTMFETALSGRSLTRKIEGKWNKITKEEYDALSEKQRTSVMLTDDSLKFYENEEGKRYCEVMLPHWFKSKLGKHGYKTDEELIRWLNTSEEGKKILSGVAFRIPTQSLSSVEIFKVKGFLPQYMGATVVVPSEITTKAGSDFDIDKLNMYLKAIYIDGKGDIRLVRYKGSEEDTKEFYGDLFDKGEFLTKAQHEELKNLKATDTDIDNLLQSIFGDLGLISEETVIEDFMKDLEELGAKEMLVNELYKKSLENEYYDSLEKLVTLPENFDRLISPVDDAGLKDLAGRLDVLKGYDASSIKNKLFNRKFMTSLRHSFSMGKKWIGIAAVSITNLSLKQKSKVYIDPAKFSKIPTRDAKILGDGKVILPHNTVMINDKEHISLSGTKVKGSEELISTRLSGYATAVVDVAKDDFISRIIESDLVVGTFMFLENIGVGEQTVFFLNQPIISKYLQMLDNDGVKNLFNKNNIEGIKNEFPATLEQIEKAAIDLNMLEGNIHSFYEKGHFKTADDNAVQHKVLNEFLKYAMMAQYNFKFTQSTNYDTAKLKSAETLTAKQWRTDIAEETNIISSAQNILDTNFIGEQRKILDMSVQAMGAVLKLDEEQLKRITDKVLRSYGENEYLSKDKYERIALQVKAAFLDYIIQNKTGVNERIKELLVNPETSVAMRVEKAKQKYPNNKLLQELEVVTSDRIAGAKSLKLAVNLKDAYDENLYTGMMRELRDENSETNALYIDLIWLSILQGTYSSPISIRNIIPIEDFSAIVSPAINSLRVNKNLEAFTDGVFQRNNFKSDEIMPVFQPKFFVTSEDPKYEQTTTMGDFYADIYQYFSPLFPSIPALGIKSVERKVLLLSEKYNSFQLKNDFIKVPRVVSDPQTGGKIDMVTGLTITKMDYITRKKKGDFSLNDVYGYQKVRYANGEPLLVYKVIKKEMTVHHVYKLINLYGDGMRATENYVDHRPSVIDNGTVKIDKEFTNDQLIAIYGQKLEEKDLSSPKKVEVKEVVEKVSDDIQIDSSIQAIIDTSNLDPSEYEVILVNGKQTFVDKSYVPKRIFKHSVKFYSDKATGGVYERYGQKLVIPGYEHIQLIMTQDNAVIELSSGMLISTYETTQEKTKEAVRKIFEKNDVDEVIAKQKKIEINSPDAVISSLTASQVEGRQIEVNQFKITIKEDGKMFYDNGEELIDQTTINKVNVRKELQDGTLRTSIYNKSKYFVLSDNRVVGSGKTNLGKESVTNPKIIESILAKAVTHKKEC